MSRVAISVAFVFRGASASGGKSLVADAPRALADPSAFVLTQSSLQLSQMRSSPPARARGFRPSVS